MFYQFRNFNANKRKLERNLALNRENGIKDDMENNIENNIENEIEKNKRTKLMRNVVLAVSGAIMISAIGSCSHPDSENAEDAQSGDSDNAAEVTSEQEGEGEQHSTEPASSTPVITGSQGFDVTPIAEGKPIYYDIENWEVSETDSFALDDLSDMKKIFGKVTSVDENSLDYDSNTAIKYRFMQGNEPYLDIIDSQQYVEFGWYYANPIDSNENKEQSIEHAKKVYQLAHNLMGEAGSTLVANMLSGHIIKNKQIGDQNVELAKCEFYGCMLILKKDGA